MAKCIAKGVTVQYVDVYVISLWRIYFTIQWRRQDSLRGGAKMAVMSWDTRGEL